MRTIFRRLAALAAALVLVCQLAAPAPAALEGVYFTAVNEILLPLNDETMPFWSNSELYVSQAIFTDGVLGVACNINRHKQLITIYSLRQTLIFDLASGTCTDAQNRSYTANVIARGNYYFFPLTLITNIFNLTWTYNSTDWAPLIRITSSSAQLPDYWFIDAGNYTMEIYYNNYVKSLASTETPQPVTPPSTVGSYSQRIYLLMDFTSADAMTGVLDLLAQQNSQATFLLTAQQIQEEGDLVRRMVAQGHAIAIAPQSSSQEDLVAELAAANAALWQAACIKTRLVYLTDAQSGLRTAVAQMGYLACTVDMDSSETPLTTSSRAVSLYSKLSAHNSDGLCVYLGAESDNLTGLPTLLRRLQSNDCPVLAYREALHIS